MTGICEYYEISENLAMIFKKVIDKPPVSEYYFEGRADMPFF